jgi:hypothetical protein
MLAAGLVEGEVTAVDPFVTDWPYGGSDTRERLEQHLEAAGLRDRVRVVTMTSRAARRTWAGRPVDLLFIDGKHDYWSTAHDLRWARHLPDGATVLVHDAYSSFGVTTALLPRLLLGRRFVVRGRTGSLVRLTVDSPGAGDRLRALAPVPWWLRNLVVKVLLRTRQRRLARALGHHDSADPY